MNIKVKKLEKPQPIKCTRCGYVWQTQSIRNRLCCPFCGRNIVNPHFDIDELIIEEVVKK